MNTLTQIATHWIGGRYVDAGERRDSINKATGELIGKYAAAGVAEAQAAIDAALSTFWKTSWKEDRLLRGRVLNTMASEFERRTEDLAKVLATENGKTLPQARFEISSVRSSSLTAAAADSIERTAHCGLDAYARRARHRPLAARPWL